MFFNSKISALFLLISPISQLSFCFFAETIVSDMFTIAYDHSNIPAYLVLALIVFFIQIKIFLVIDMKKEFYFKYFRYSVTRS